jgi:DNA-binding CsgD family transcriptional regulator
LVLRGEPGVGKTALLDFVEREAQGCQVVRACGVQSEAELAFSGLYQVCVPMLDRVEQLPAPQGEALLTAFGLADQDPHDRFVVSMATLGLLAEYAREQPVVCVVDDAQWLDHASAQVLGFVARRLAAESVGLIFAARGTNQPAELSTLPTVVVGGLPSHAARALLQSTITGPMDDRIVERLVAETRGNPLALLELPRTFTSAELSAGFTLNGPRALSAHIEESYRRRLEPLPPVTRQLLLLAAAEPLGDPVLVWRAAERLAITMQALRPASEAGLIDIDTRVRFAHPLMRSAVYWAASAEQRCAAHRALCETTDPARYPDRRAWHRAQATMMPDEDVAAELEEYAGKAQARGGPAAAAAFLERAAELTPGRLKRAERALAAARAAHQAGESQTALRLLSIAAAAPPDEQRNAHVDELRSHIAFVTERSADSADALLRAAQRLASFDVNRARDTYLAAVAAAMFAGPSAGANGVLKVARAARGAPRAPQPSRPSDLLLDGLVARFADGYADGVSPLKAALRAFAEADACDEEQFQWFWLAHVAAVDIFDFSSWDALSKRQVRFLRDAGALSSLPLALCTRICAHVFAGDLASAASLVGECRAATEATGSRLTSFGTLQLAAWQGAEDKAMQLIDTTSYEVAQRGEDNGLVFTSWTQSLLYNSLGKYHDALAAAQKVTKHAQEFGLPTWGALVETVEAATRSGQPQAAAQAHRRLAIMTQASGSEWALGLEARSRALLVGRAAEPAYVEAIERLQSSGITGELARAHLLYGEWLRRQRRPLDARRHLAIASDLFTGMDAEAFAVRADRELHAAGGHSAKRHKQDEPPNRKLTAQEAQILRLVRDELSNQEIAARLFISRRTVEWHLGKIFTKLGVTSRRQLHR